MHIIENRKISLLLIIEVFIVFIGCIDIRFGILLLVLYLIMIILLAFGLVINELIKHTHWYMNIFVHTNQFVTNVGYRENHLRNYDIVNLGSNPAVFAFFYETVKGQNWATGAQGPQMDFEILKYYYSYLKEGGIVLLPLVAFSSCSTYLTHYKPDRRDMIYYARFAKIIENFYQARSCIPNIVKVRRWIKYPFFYRPRSLKYLIHDVAMDNRHLISEQPMQLMELIVDAERWIKGWKEEFDIKDLNAPLSEKMAKCHDECAHIFASIIDFCKERALKPYIILPPMSDVLSKRFSNEAKETYIYSFIRRIQQITEVDVLDYMNDERYSSPSLYFNSLFLNLRGRKCFTKQVLRDLKI